MRYPAWRLLLFVCAASVPAYWLYLAATAALGPDPGKVLVDNLGEGALILLLCSLAMTPLQKLTGWSGWIAFRPGALVLWLRGASSHGLPDVHSGPGFPQFSHRAG